MVESWSGYMLADRIRSIFGTKSAVLRYNSPLSYLTSVAPTLRRAHVYFWVLVGTRDPYLWQDEVFASLLARERVAHRLILRPGAHDWALWRKTMPLALRAIVGHVHG